MNVFSGIILAALAVCCYGANTARIIGGSDAPEGLYPYQVSLRKANRHFCGGSVLNEHWVLTAAHCLDGMDISDMTAVVGTNLLTNGGDAYIVESTITHPDWNYSLLKNDAGLVRLKSQVLFDKKVQPIALPTEDFTDLDQPAILSGWGRTAYPGDIPDALQHIDLKVIPQNTCAATSWIVTDSNICTLTQAGEGACHGDSGGPLVADGVQIGIVSWGTPCAKGHPDVFTRVYSFINWINDNISN